MASADQTTRAEPNTIIEDSGRLRMAGYWWLLMSLFRMVAGLCDRQSTGIRRRLVAFARSRSFLREMPMTV
jgi:hypothetical protein